MTDIVERLRHWQRGEYTIDPPGANKAIFYEGDCGEAADEIVKLRAERDALREWLFARGAMEDPPCFVCGYNGPGYFQPDKHPCAAKHHAAIDAARRT